MRKICVNGIALHPAARAKLEMRYEVVDDLARVNEATAAIVYGAPDEWMEAGVAPKLRIVGCHSRSEAFNEWAKTRGVQIALADSLWRTVAEHTLALLFTAARNVPAADRAVRNGEWRDHEALKIAYSGFDLQGKTLGILGLGQIGMELADILRGFRMRVLYNDIVRKPDLEATLGVRYASFDQVLRESDILCVLLPLNPDTRGILDARAFAQMKRGCIFINTARAGLVDEDAFLAALDDGTIAAAGLDVFWDEATEQKEALTKRENVVMTPHLGGSTLECDLSLVEPVCEIPVDNDAGSL